MGLLQRVTPVSTGRGASTLEQLESLCDRFDTLCQREPARPQSHRDLVHLHRRLLAKTVNMFELIDAHRANGGEEQALQEFRETLFHQKVVRHYRRNPACDRLWTKPSGYSGDYSTIELLCQGISRWTTFDDLFLNHLVECAMGRQHRGKVLHHASFLTRALTQTPVRPARILDIGCGPSFDLRLALDQAPAGTEADILLADLDPAALEFSRSRLTAAPTGIRIDYQQGDIVKILRQLSTEQRTFDAILFGGLFDYIPDRLISLILRKSATLLAPGGSILFSQVSPSNPDRTAMHWLADWRLIERDEQHLLQLIADAGLVSAQTTHWRESTGCAILCQITP